MQNESSYRPHLPQMEPDHPSGAGLGPIADSGQGPIGDIGNMFRNMFSGHGPTGWFGHGPTGASGHGPTSAFTPCRKITNFCHNGNVNKFCYRDYEWPDVVKPHSE